MKIEPQLELEIQGLINFKLRSVCWRRRRRSWSGVACRWRVRAEEPLQLVEAEADDRDGGGLGSSRLTPLSLRLGLEEALPARRRRLPGRRRARGGLPQVGDPAARRRLAVVVVVVVPGEHERRLRGAGRREGRRAGGLEELGRRGHGGGFERASEVVDSLSGGIGRL